MADGPQKRTRSIEGNEIVYSNEKFLGSGNFGQIYLYDSSRKVVWKKVGLASSPKVNALEMAEQEANILSMLCHPSIVRILNSWKDETVQALVMELEFCGGGDLRSKLRQVCAGKRKKFTMNEIKNWIAQLAQGVSYIHDLDIVHRDLKPANIFFSTDEKVLKIGDFGIARIFETTNVVMQDIVGTYPYMPPEMFKNEQTLQVKTKGDLWALGVIIFELIVLERPFEVTEANAAAIFAEYLKLYCDEKKKPEKIGEVQKQGSQELRQLVEEKLLVIRATDRADIDLVLADTFFTSQPDKDPPIANYIQEKIKKLREQLKTEKTRNSVDQLMKSFDKTNFELKKLRDELEKSKQENEALKSQLQNHQFEKSSLNVQQFSPEQMKLDEQLYNAAKDNNTSSVLSLVSQGARNSHHDSSGYTAIRWAAFHGNVQVGKSLLSLPTTDINTTDNNNVTPLMIAAFQSKLDFVKLLVEKGADTKLKDKDDETALDMAHETIKPYLRSMNAKK